MIKPIIFKKPILAVRIIVNYFRSFVFKEKTARKVEVGVSFDCQCNCVKCSSALMRDVNKEKLSVQDYRQFARDIIKLGAVHINFTGGEALMAENIIEIISSFYPHKLLISINSNALLLSDSMIDKLETAGVDIIKISVDSPVAEEHDASRGYKGCFSRSVKALKYIKNKKRMLGHISTVCTKEILGSGKIWEIVEMADEYDALLGLTIPTNSGRWVKNQNILLGKEEKVILKRLSRIPYVVRDIEEGYMKKRCPAGYEELYLTCYGDVIPCPFIQISFGNIKEERIKIIWKRMFNFEEFKNNNQPMCIAGENKAFIEKYLLPLKDYNCLPVFIDDYLRKRGR